jgi:hypothetical protein
MSNFALPVFSSNRLTGFPFVSSSRLTDDLRQIILENTSAAQTKASHRHRIEAKDETAGGKIASP